MHAPPSPFSQHVRDALAHLHAISYLTTHPLANELSSGPALRQVLLQAIEDMRPAEVTPATQAHARRQQHLVLRYVDGLSPDQVARRLMVSARQASRDLHQALQELTLLLWSRRVGAPSPQVDSADAAGTSADLQQVLRGVLGTLRKLLGAGGERKLPVRVALPDTLPSLAVDPDLLRQALLNLLLYVASSSPQAQSVVSASESARGVLLRLGLENGLDLRVAASASDEARALLDSGQRLLGMLGGDLVVGRDLTIALPAAGRYKLLVVDDNPDIGGLFRRYLRGEGYRVLQATSGAAALRLAREFRPHVVLLDVLLPSRDGWEIMSDLRSTPSMADTPVVICSVLPQEAMARSLHAADFLAKPVTRQSLLALLERWQPPLERTTPPAHS